MRRPGELLEIHGLDGMGVETYQTEYEPIPGGGGTPFRTMLPINLGEFPMHMTAAKASPRKALRNAQRYMRKRKYMAANAWARRAFHTGNPGQKKMAAKIMMKTDEAGLAGLV